MQDQPITDPPVPASDQFAPEPQPKPQPEITLIDRITGAASEFAASVRKMETAKTEHGSTVTARQQAQVAEDAAMVGVTDAKASGVAAADRLIAVINEWRTNAVSG